MAPKTPKNGTPKPKKSFSGLKISKKLFTPVGKKVSFGPEVDMTLEKERQMQEKERELMERERKLLEREKKATIEKEKNNKLKERLELERQVMEREKKAKAMEKEREAASSSGTHSSTPPTPRNTSMKGKKRVQFTPYPPTSKQADMTSSGANSAKNSGKEDGRQKRRKMKRQSYTLFANSSSRTVKSRPSNTLTAQLNYTLENLPDKMHALKNDTKMCFAARINELEKLEDNLLKRLEIVSNLKLENPDDELNDRKYEVIEEMENKVMEIQAYKESKEAELQFKRPGLRANHSDRFVCCPVCAKKRIND